MPPQESQSAMLTHGKAFHCVDGGFIEFKTSLANYWAESRTATIMIFRDMDTGDVIGGQIPDFSRPGELEPR